MLATRPYAIPENQTVPNRRNQICGEKNKTGKTPQNSQLGESREEGKGRENTHKRKVKKNK